MSDYFNITLYSHHSESICQNSSVTSKAKMSWFSWAKSHETGISLEVQNVEKFENPRLVSEGKKWDEE